MSTSASPAVPLSPTPAAQRVAALERTVTQLQNAQAEFATTVNGELQGFGARLGSLESHLRRREEEIKSALDQTAAQRSSELAADVADATAEFNNQRTSLQNVTTAVQAEFQRLQEQVEQAGKGAGGGGREGREFLPHKGTEATKVGKRRPVA